jgi:hypothetical protein
VVVLGIADELRLLVLGGGDDDAWGEEVGVVQVREGFILGSYVTGVLLSEMEVWDTVCSRKQLSVRITTSAEGDFL